MSSLRPYQHAHAEPYDEPHFRPLPVDASPLHTPPRAYSPANDRDPFGTPYSSYYDPHTSTRAPASTKDRDSFPPASAPPPAPAPLRRPRSRWSSFWATYNSKNQLTFLTIFGVQAAAVLSMILLIYITIHNNIGDLRTSDLFDQDPQLESVATYVSLFILAVVFELLVILDACQQKNIIGIICIDLFQLALLVYSAVLPRQLANALDGSNADTPRVRYLVYAYSVVIPCVIGASTLAFFYLTWRLYEEFGWDVFKRIGADIKIRKCYQRYEIFVALLKFDAFAFLGFEIQFLVLVTGTRTVEFVLTIIALPVILVALALTAVVVRVESRPGVYISLLCQAAGMAYFAYKLARIYSDGAGPRYSAAKATLTIFSVVGLVMLVSTFVLTGLCMTNFGKGLKEKIPGYAFNGGRSFLPGGSSRNGGGGGGGGASSFSTFDRPSTKKKKQHDHALGGPKQQSSGSSYLDANGGGGGGLGPYDIDGFGRPGTGPTYGEGNRREYEIGRSETRMSID